MNPFEKGCKNNLGTESMYAKYVGSLYKSGVSEDWVKLTSSQILPLKLTHLNKLLWTDPPIKKQDVIDYYDAIHIFILPHLKDRPLSLLRHPEGPEQEGFFQKNIQGYLPRFVETKNILSESSHKSIQYVLYQNRDSLLYLNHLGCIEMHPWISRKDSLEFPDYVVIDIDPDQTTFSSVIKVARSYAHVLSQINVTAFLKTSGGRGLHIYIPTLNQGYTYEKTRSFAKMISHYVHQQHQHITSVERKKEVRKNKIYLDCFQNAKGQTIAAPYSIRAKKNAPVSTPLKWTELTEDLDPKDFNIFNTLERISKVGELWKSFYTYGADLEKAEDDLRRIYG